jgi:hypothetical protein
LEGPAMKLLIAFICGAIGMFAGWFYQDRREKR